MPSPEPAAPPEPSSLTTSLWGPPWYGQRPREALLPERAPWVSVLLGMVQVALFLGERAWGVAGASAVLLRRLGAAWSPVAFGSEAWRWVSAGFVVREGTQLGVQLAALLVGGVYVEGLLGPSRLVLLYVASLALSQALRGGCFPEGLGVGASGGLCGLGAALLVLACHPRVPLPRRHRVAPGVAALVVLGLAWKAEGGVERASGAVSCLAGAAVGLSLALSGVLTREAPRYVWHSRTYAHVPERPGVSASARVVAVLTAACLAMALWRGHPWTLSAEQTWVRRSVPGTGVTVAVPSGAAPQPEVPSREGEGVTAVYGEAWRDPMVVTVNVQRLERAVPETRLEAETQALRDELRVSEREPVPTEDLLLWTAPSVETLPGGPAVYSSREAGPGSWSSRWVMLRDRWRISLEARYAHEEAEGWSARVEQMARSVEVYEP